ncbi:MAG: hypothetical protein JWO05_1888 [Gemmatimonadetes bacterium]|nr:hypothetical protein [Gemmatimonadota bacterium]
MISSILRTIRVVAIASVALTVGTAPIAHAQQPNNGPETVRGRVVDDSGKVVVAATVIVTRGPDRLVQQTTTDSSGRFSTRFEQGTGDYLVYVAAPFLKSARRRVTRAEGSGAEVIADFTLSHDITTLGTVKTNAIKPERATNTIRPQSPETGANEKWQDGVSGQLSPTTQGDLNALAGNMPGVTLTPNGPSILGAGRESNLTTLNGLGMSGASIPRAAKTETRVTGATFDPTRGGFAGANIDVRLGPGDRFYQQRRAFLTLDSPQMQFTDAVGRALGVANGGFRGSFGADGELVRKALTYNVALDVGRTASDPATLLDADRETLLRAGISPDSVARLLLVAPPLGLALSGSGAPSQRQRDAITWLGRLDDTRDTMQTRAFTTYLGYTNEGALGFAPTTAPSAGGQRRERTLGAQLTLGAYVGPGRRTLTETRLAASSVSTRTSAYRNLPGATVLVRSPTIDAQSDVTGVSLGGSPFLAGDQDIWTLEGANETIWNARGRRHRFKALAWGRADGSREQVSANELGTFTFNSIADLAAGRASSYSRTLSQPTREGSVWNTAAAIAHQWLPSRYFNVLYGLRAEADGFASTPASNPALESALGVKTGAAPSRVHVSPRAGFSYTYSRDRENGSGTNQTNVGRFYRNTQGVIRGGIGEFRDLLRPGLLADASAGTGLDDGTRTLSCVGAAVPAIDWTKFTADPSSIPSSCANGGGVLSESVRSATLIDPSYDVSRSWRANLDWTTAYHKMIFHASALGSYDLNQPGTVDANFGGLQRFALSDEGNRAVYVTPASIDAGSGAVSPTESRRSAQYGRVGVRTSDLRGYGGQLTLGLAPDVFKFRGRGSFFGSVNYTLQSTKRQYRGFDGAALDDPRLKEWSAGANDARHVVLLQAGMDIPKVGTLTMFGRAQSGLPFTPLVGGDVNGDGRGGDRAFIPNPATTGDATLASQLRALMTDGSDLARECISANLGRAVARNACRGPWTESLNMQLRPQIPGKFARRVTGTIYFQNVLGGLDQALHGNNLRGWGSDATPDQVLLIPRGFDAAAKKFRYDVNPRFADTRAARTLIRNPFRLVLDFSVNLAVNYDVQQLRRALEPIRTPKGWEQRSADSLAGFYLENTSSIYKALLQESDSLFLSPAQVKALQVADSAFSAQVRGQFIPLGQFLSAQRGHEPGKIELDSVTKTQKEYWRVFWLQPEIADSIITPTQKELFPMLKNIVSVPKREREFSQWQFGNPVLLKDGKDKPGAGGVQVRQ